MGQEEEPQKEMPKWMRDILKKRNEGIKKKPRKSEELPDGYYLGKEQDQRRNTDRE